MMNCTAEVDKDQIIIKFPFRWDFINIVKTINGRSWNGTAWVLPNTSWHCAQVVDKLKPLGFEIDQSIVNGSDQKAPPPKRQYPKGLYPFQRRGVDFLFDTSGRAIVADEMGLGKTIETLAYIGIVSHKVLIVAPANVIYKWEAECHKWLPGWGVQVIATGKDEIDDCPITILSYTIMVSQYDSLKDILFDTLVFDEGHYIKSSKAQRTRVAKALTRRYIPHVLFLSGTPFMNRPIELFPLLNIIDPVGFNNFVHFARQYCGAMYEMGHWFFPKNAVTNRDELADRLRHYMLRRTKKEVGLDLPDLTRTSIPIELSNRREYVKARKDMKKWLDEQDKSVLNPNHVLTRLNVLRQIVGQGKVAAALELADNILQDGKKVVFFAHHKDVVRQLSNHKYDGPILYITGDVSAKQRLENTNLFLDNPKYRVMIITVAGAEGIDLFSASDIIFVEREWTPAREEQAEARLHRLGQKNPVNAYYIVAKGTVDEKLNNLVEDKRAMIGSVIHHDDIITYVLQDML